MASVRETEIKLPVRDRKSLMSRLKALGFRRSHRRHLEVNLVLDFPDLRLRRAKCLLRLRFEGKRCLLTFKSAPTQSRRHKTRVELETWVESGERLKRVLESLGLRETFRYEKYRTSFARPRELVGPSGAVLEYDETPFGNFLELEGPPHWIDQVASQLGYTLRDYVTASYAALYFESCRKLGKMPGNMVFDTQT
jgi:adenylate cyclase class 2